VEAPEGVPISAFIFGGRRRGWLRWSINRLTGSTACLSGDDGFGDDGGDDGRRGNHAADPMAMLPFCGYNMADYFEHWLEMGKKIRTTKIFHVNWFRKGAMEIPVARLRENVRVLKWILERVEGRGEAKETPIATCRRGGVDAGWAEDFAEALDELFA